MKEQVLILGSFMKLFQYIFQEIPVFCNLIGLTKAAK